MILGRTSDIRTWIFHLIFFYKENIFRKLFPLMAVLTGYTLLIMYLDTTWHLVAAIIDRGLEQFHIIFSFILAFFISFRVNTSYGRWWEARILWGSLVNTCRNVALKFNVYVDLNNYPELKQIIAIYPNILKLHLRKDNKAIAEEFNKYSYELLEGDNPMVFLNHKLFVYVNELRKENKISLEQFLALDQCVAGLMDITGGCERILNTRPPSAFAFLARQALLVYALTFPFGWVDTFGVIAIPFLLIIVYVLFGLEVLAEEMENPFGLDDHDLPIDGIATTIAKNVNAIQRYKI